MSSKSKLLVLFVVLISDWIRSGQAEDQPWPRWLRPNHLANIKDTQINHGIPESYAEEVPQNNIGLHVMKRRQANNNQIKGVSPIYNWMMLNGFRPIPIGLSTKFVLFKKPPHVIFNKPRFGEDEDGPVWSVEGANLPQNNIPSLTVDFDKEYFNTLTGISLEPVKPLRPNSRLPPPILHGSNMKPQNPEEDLLGSYPQQSPKASENSACDRGKISCCNRGLNIRALDQCFTNFGCPGPFYEDPCLKDGTR